MSYYKINQEFWQIDYGEEIEILILSATDLMTTRKGIFG